MAKLLPVTFLLLSLAPFSASAACRDGKCDGADDGDADVLLQSRVKVAGLEPRKVKLTQAEEDIHKRLAARKPLLIEQDLSSLHESHYAKLNRRSKSIYDALIEAFSQTVDTTGIAQELTDEEKTNFAARFEEDAETFLKHAGISSADMEKDLEDGHIDIIDETLWQNAIKHALQREKPVCTEKIEESINSAQQQFQISCKGWKNSSVHDAHKLLGVPQENHTDPSFIERSSTTPDYEHMFDASITPPAQFDGRTAFPACSDVVGRVHAQGTCGSCWAFAALGALDSRICIKTGGSFSGENAMLSRGYVTSCATEHGCQGAWPSTAYDIFREHGGGVTGGSNGCSPYFGHGNSEDHFGSDDEAPPCPTQCGNSGYFREMSSDKFSMPSLAYSEVFRDSDSEFSQLSMQQALSQNGPVAFAMHATDAFMGYSSGIFTGDCTDQANHAVVAIGYGADYVLAVNSWGSSWGDGGSFKQSFCAVVAMTLTSFSETTGSFPSPLFAQAPAPPPPPAADCGTGAWCVTSGPCTMEQGSGCVMSPNWNGESGMYNNDESCEISVVETTGMEVVDFNVEKGYDTLMVNGIEFVPSDFTVQPTGSMTWSSDYSITDKGWKICPKAQACGNQVSDQDCDYWASEGYCTDHYVDYMTANCSMSCGFCQAATTTTTTQATTGFKLVGTAMQCSQSGPRVILESGSSDMTTDNQGPQLCGNMAASDSRCGSFFEVGGGYCMCYTGSCTSTIHDAGEDLYEIVQAAEPISTCSQDTYNDHSCRSSTHCGCGGYCSSDYCRQACGNQVSDQDCETWASAGYCTDQWVDYMTINCQMSCGFCQAR